jgi:hypothetical protein
MSETSNTDKSKTTNKPTTTDSKDSKSPNNKSDTSDTSDKSLTNEEPFRPGAYIYLFGVLLTFFYFEYYTILILFN